MNSTVEDIGPCKRKLTITVDVDRIQSEIRKSYDELKSSVSVPGFRKGKTPHSVLEKRYGEHVIQDVKNELVRNGLQLAIEENELEVVTHPHVHMEEIDFKADAQLSFEATVEVKPGFTLPEYKGIQTDRTVGDVTKEEVDSILGKMRHDRSAWVPVENEPAQESDHIIGSLVLEADGHEVFNREDASTILEDDDKMIVGVPLGEAHDELKECELGKTVSWEANLPDDHYIKDIQGKSVSATFTVREIKRMEVPELDDNLAVEFGCEDLDDLRGKINEDLKKHKDHQANREVEDRVLEKLVGMTDFDLPETVVEDATMERVRNEIIQRMMSGAASQDDIKDLGESLKDEMQPEVENQVKAWYIMEKIAANEKIFATEEDIHDRVKEIAISQGQTPTQVLEEIVKNDQMARLRSDVLERKVRKFLIQEAEITEKSGGEEPKPVTTENGQDDD